MDNQSFVGFLSDVKSRAEGFIGEDYISEDVRKCLRDFLKVVESFNALQSDSVSSGADARLFKKRLDQSKAELKAAEKRIEALKGIGFGLVIPAKQLSNELSSVKDPAVVARMQAAVKKIADSLIEISKI
jgi:hypothetical protein